MWICPMEHTPDLQDKIMYFIQAVYFVDSLLLCYIMFYTICICYLKIPFSCIETLEKIGAFWGEAGED